MNGLISIVTGRIKRLCSLREPPYELPADSFIDEASEDIINSFINFALNSLQLSEVPPISFVLKRKEGMTHGYFNSGNNQILVYTKNRAIADFLRSLSHELVHYKQNINNELYKKNIPEVGGEIEDEANALGGSIIKAFGKENPVIYEL
jgi:hypothetical protein